MRISIMTAAALALLLAGSAMAQESTPGRYTMTPVGEGMLRLDTQTGAISRCMRTSDNWVCKSVADDRLALENEIDQLSIENQRLRAKLAQSGIKPPPEQKTEPDNPDSWLPDDKHFEEFMSFFEKIMRRFKQIAESMQNEMSPERP